MDFINELFLTGAGLVAVLIALIPLIITIALVVAIFQINGRIGQLLTLQQQTNAQLAETADLQRHAFIAKLSAEGPNHRAYLDYLVDTGQLTQDQANFVLRQSGND